jgi:hypothetical protein
MDVSHRLDKENKLYTFVDRPGTGNLDDINQRFSNFGSIGCVVDDASDENQIFGVIYATTVIELYEFCPITSVAPTAAIRLSKKLSLTRTIGPAKLEAERSISGSKSTRESLEKLAKLGHLHTFVEERKREGKWIPAIPGSLLKLSRDVATLETKAADFTESASVHIRKGEEVTKRLRSEAKPAYCFVKDLTPDKGVGDIT